MLRDEKTLVFDPFKGTGLPEPRARADIVLCSHSHSDHNNVGAVKYEKSIVLEGFTGAKQIDNISIKGIATFHDDAQGSKRGKNSVCVVGLDSVNFCHLGDLGQLLSPSQIGELGSVDVLFLPVGGFYTIGPEQGRKVMESIKPKIAVPMHYRLAGMSSAFNALSTVEDFIRRDDNVKRLDGPTFTVSKVDLPEKTQIIIPKLG
jgi:L-ascorbate metabolism protein UlaG (beta-lactamase superfamily)